jgi:hypothetical protein
VILLLACLVEPESQDLPELSAELFDAEVQPVLGPSCASSACHGDPTRPLELYQPGWHRADPDRRFLDEPLTDDERAANFARARAFVDPIPEDSLLLRKGLDPARGGLEHDPGPTWLDPDEDDYQTVLWWAAGGGT